MVGWEVAVSAEELARREQATPEELERFVELAHLPAGEDDTRTVLHNFLLETSGMRNLDEGHHYVRQASQDSDYGLGKLYGEIYPGSSAEERRGIAWADAAAIVRTHYLLWESYNDPSECMYDVDKSLFDEASFGLSLDEERRGNFQIRTRTLEASPLYRQRLEQGMSRTMQLFVAAQAMQRLHFDEHWRQKHANAFYHLPELWDFSDAETKTVTQLVAGSGEYAPRLVSLMATDERLLERYRGQDGIIDIEQYGGAPALAADAQSAFRQFIRWGKSISGRGREWLDMESNLALELAEIFPYGARKAMAFDEWLKHPQPAQPDEALQTYISLPEAARLSNLYIAEDTMRFDHDDVRDAKRWTGRPSRRWAARKLGCSSEIVEGATYKDYENLFEIIEKHADADAPELAAFATGYKIAGETLDAGLAELLKDYYYAATDSGLAWPVEGWSGAPEEEAVVRQMSVERDAKFQKLHDLEQAIKQKTAA